MFTFTLTVFTGFFAIMNPIAITPIFLGMVTGETADSKKKIAKTASITAFLIVASFVVVGKYIFELFGITVPAFKITGGILIFYVGFGMLMSRPSKIHNTDSAGNGSDIAVSPLAIPILAGPGTIVTAMNFVTNARYWHIAVVLVVFAFICWLTYVAFRLSDRIVAKLGNNLIQVIGKLMGLIIAIIGTQMVIEGIKLSFHLLMN